MTEKKILSPIRRAIMVGALAASGCSPATPVTEERREAPATPPAPAPTPPMSDLPPELSRYIDLEPGRLHIDLVLGNERLPLLVVDPTDASQQRFNRAIRQALEQPQRYDQVGLRFTDAQGELPECATMLEIPQEARTRDGLSQRLAYLTQEAIILRAAMECSSALAPAAPQAPEEEWSAPPVERQPVNPLTIARHEPKARMQLDGRIDPAVTQINI